MLDEVLIKSKHNISQEWEWKWEWEGTGGICQWWFSLHDVEYEYMEDKSQKGIYLGCQMTGETGKYL